MAKSSMIGKGPVSIILPSGGGSDTPEQVRDKLASLTGSNKIESESVYYNDTTTDLGVGIDSAQEAIEAIDAAIDALEADLEDKTYTTEMITLDTFDISAKYITLQGVPTNDQLTSVTVGGVAQTFGADFGIVGTQLAWTGLGMDGLLEIGDILTIVYN